MYPGLSGAAIAGFTRRTGTRVESFILDGAERAQRAVASLPVVEDLQILEDRVGQLDAGLPPAAVE
jgi:hypothetical protein